MIAHTNDFKNEISLLGKQIRGKIIHYFEYGIATESNNVLITEDGNTITTEQIDNTNYEDINEELIYKITLVNNGQLFKSLMKELDFECKTEFKIGDTINPRLGILIDDEYEYLDYKNYIIYSKNYNAENQMWDYVCFNTMLYSMIPYKGLNITYPISVRNYIGAIADKMGVGFASSNTNFVNYDYMISEDFFNGKDVTYRDILDKLSEITGSNILINSSGQLEVKYLNETNDTINEKYFKDVNVNFAETFGEINRINLIDSENKVQYTARADLTLEDTQLTTINFVDNPLMLNGNPTELCENILNQVKGITYSLNDFESPGICYYEYLDIYHVSVRGKTYQCLLLNNEINITQGIQEKIFTKLDNNYKSENDIYGSQTLSDKQIKTKLINLDEKKVENKTVINSINQSEENVVINYNKFLKYQTVSGTTDSDGFLDTGLGDTCVLVATKSLISYGFIIPYYDYNAKKWYVKIQDKSGSVLINAQASVKIYYFIEGGNN